MANSGGEGHKCKPLAVEALAWFGVFDPPGAIDHLDVADFARHYLTTQQARIAELEAEVEAMREFLHSINTMGFEEWYGSYQDGQFHIFDSDGNGVASGSGPFEAWKEFVKEKE